MKYIVAGGREFTDWKRLSDVLDKFACEHTLRTVISGGARGADTFAIEWAEENDCWCELEVMLPDYKVHGRYTAPKIRNQQMAQAADGLIAFWDGRSPGTKDMIEKAVRCNLEVHIYRY